MSGAQTLPPIPVHGWLRWDVVDRMLSAVAPLEKVLEIGPGVGGFGARLARRWSYTAVEPDRTSHALAAQRVAPYNGRVLNGDVSVLDPGALFDLVCAFEVLEHLPDDGAAVREWLEKVRPGGWMVLSVPAHQDRCGAWDAAAGHYRRYDRDQLFKLLSTAGLTDIELRSYGYPVGNVLEVARNVAATLRPGPSTMDARTAESGRLLQPSERHALVTRLLSAPFRRIQRIFERTDLGTGLVARARRPASGRD